MGREFAPLNNGQKDETSTTKDMKITIRGRLRVKTLKRSDVRKSRKRSSIDEIDESKNRLTPECLRDRRSKEKCTSSVQDVTMLVLSNTILSRCVST